MYLNWESEALFLSVPRESKTQDTLLWRWKNFENREHLAKLLVRVEWSDKIILSINGPYFFKAAKDFCL